MKFSRQHGFTVIELLVVIAIIGLIAVAGWGVLEGWRERNALRMVSQDVKYLFEKYRQRAIDKGYNYGLIFSDDGVYVFEDNGGTGIDRFQAVNNFSVDAGEYSDRVEGSDGINIRALRRVSSEANEYKMFSNQDPAGRIIVMTMNTLDLDSGRTGKAYEPAGDDISSYTIQPFTGSDYSPFEAGSLALIFSPNGFVYLKDPSISAGALDRAQYRLGTGASAFYVIRIAYDNPNTNVAELPNYYEIAINRYGATTFVRWESNDGGSSWNAHIQ